MKIAFNKHLCIPLFLFTVFLYMSVSCADDQEWAMVALSLLFALLAFFAILIQPLIIVFQKDEINIIYTVGVKETIRISQIHNIYQQGHWFAGGRGCPVYVVCYPHASKKAFFMISEIPKTRKTKKLLKQFYNKTID